jgi:hypothetical protein
MKALIAVLLAGASLALSSATASAASACTAYIRVGGEDARECMNIIGRRTRDADLKSSRTGETHFFWFGQNVVTTRCIDGDLVAMAAYHRQDDRACPLLDRVKDAIQAR